ncbi:hypothetical protein STENM327S_06225 [Streptomyces tendae]
MAVGADQLAQRQAPAGTVEVDRAAVAPVVDQQAPGGEGVEHGPGRGGERTVGGESETADARQVQLGLPQLQHAEPGRVDPAVTVGAGQAHAHRPGVGRPAFAVEADVPVADRRTDSRLQSVCGSVSSMMPKAVAWVVTVAMRLFQTSRTASALALALTSTSVHSRPLT